MIYRLLVSAVMLLLLHPATPLSAQGTQEDSLRIMAIFDQMTTTPQEDVRVVDIARCFLGTPYVAKTLEKYPTERLIVNTLELDCTTFVENTLAVYLCLKHGQTDMRSFRKHLSSLRYKDGKIGYAERLHYFTSWIDNAIGHGMAEEDMSLYARYHTQQTLRINFMSTHTSLYPMLNGREKLISQIRTTEQQLTGRQISYVPKAEIADNSHLRSKIKDGDIIAIMTNKPGLDTSHLGIAVWHADGLHMIHASQIMGKVTEDTTPLRQYMQHHPSQTGIRVIHFR